MDEIFSITDRSIRLKEERKKLKLTQVKAAEIIGVLEASWIRYEKHGEAMNEIQIYALKNFGFDMSYVLFGSSHQKNEVKDLMKEKLILSYELVSDDHKEGLLALVESFAKSYPKK